jgi:hypothetical protein
MLSSLPLEPSATRLELRAFYAWIVAEHGRLQLEVRKLTARVRENYPLARANGLHSPCGQSWSQLCGQMCAVQLDFDLFDQCYLLAAGQECEDYLPAEISEVQVLWERYLAFKRSKS